VLRDASIIHCDLKPENILLCPGTAGQLKLIDFGSACFEGRTVYSYIQSRFYRSPEVMLGVEYTAAIDMWSFGCVAAELFLGLPLFPGASEHDLLSRVLEMLGPLPPWMLSSGKYSEKFFAKSAPASPAPRVPTPGGAVGGSGGSNGATPSTSTTTTTTISSSSGGTSSSGAAGGDIAGLLGGGQWAGNPPGAAAAEPWRQCTGADGSTYVLRTKAEFEAHNGVRAPAGKRYFSSTQLADILGHYPMKNGLTEVEEEAERKQREALLDLLLGVLDLDPMSR
jgi:hypothetical protein